MSGSATIPPTGNIGYAVLDASGNVLVLAWMPFAQWVGAQPASSVAVDPMLFAQMYAGENAGARYVYSAGAFQAVPAKALFDSVQTAALTQIDTKAETCRQQFLTTGAGQAMVYQAKGQQAALFLAEYPTAAAAASADPNAWPLLQAELGITASTLWGVAAVVGATGSNWTVLAAVIEQIRLGAKMLIAGAQTDADVAEIVAGAVFPVAGQAQVGLVSAAASIAGWAPSYAVEIRVAGSATILGGKPGAADMVAIPAGANRIICGAPEYAVAVAALAAPEITGAPPSAKAASVVSASAVVSPGRVAAGAGVSFGGPALIGGDPVSPGATLPLLAAPAFSMAPAGVAAVAAFSGPSAISGGQPTASTS